MSVSSVEITQDKSVARLRTGALNLIETVGQSLAAIAPTLTPALNISVVAGLAGLGCWLSYFIGTLGVVLVAACVGVLASRHPEAGSYFVYIGRSFGPFAGALAGWSMISAYMFTAVAVTLSFAIFLGDFLAAFGVRLGMLPTTLWMLLFIATVTYAAYRDVKLSSRVGLILELVSVGIVIVITASSSAYEARRSTPPSSRSPPSIMAACFRRCLLSSSVSWASRVRQLSRRSRPIHAGTSLWR